MSNKRNQSAWNRYEGKQKPKSTVYTNGSIRDREIKDEDKRALGRLAHEAWLKEYELKNAQGPHSTPEPHYERVVKALPYKGNE